ncbi:MAG TPA: hypothetical protein DEB40_01160 [Elusimicrobia bacterium]|nr:hypothetical protein [Elusimicrobiota bacterium]HBT60338.1 hypothetical protein [Elusimicrobiota bacterium]
MKRCLMPFLVLIMAACHHRRTLPDYGETKARAAQAFDATAAKAGSVPSGERKTAGSFENGAPLRAEAPPPSAKIGEKDALGCTWVEAESTLPVGEHETRAQARAAALEKARDIAMRDLLGIDVNQRSLDFQQEGLRGQTALIENILRTTRRGRILNERVLADEYRDLGDCRQCAFYVRLRACIKERAAEADKDFHVELSLSRDRFVEGDSAKLTVTSSRDAYVYLYDVGMNSETWLVVPNAEFPEVRVKAGQAWEYPDEAAAKRGVRLEARLPDDRPPVSAETLRVIATKTPLPLKFYTPDAGGYLGVMRKLNASALEWADDAAAFAIYPAKNK